MDTTLPPRGQVAEQGRRYYREKLAHLLEPEHNGKYLVLDIESGDYEVDADHMTALARLRGRHADKIFYAARIGYGALFTIGGRWKASP